MGRSGSFALAMSAVFICEIVTTLPVHALDVLVGDTGNSSVLRFNGSTGAFQNVLITAGSGGLASPRAILQGSDGAIYVASYQTDSVKKYDGATGGYLGDFVAAGSGGLDGPEGMTWGPDGDLFVSSFLTDQIIRYAGPNKAVPGALVGVFVAAGSGGLDGPKGLAFGNDQYLNPAGPAQDGQPDLVVASSITHQVLWYNGLTGVSVGSYISASPAMNLRLPASLMFERITQGNKLVPGNLHVSSNNGANSVINVYSGVLPESFFFSMVTGNGLVDPWGMTWGPDVNGDQKQDLYISNTGGATKNVLRYAGNGTANTFIAAGAGGLSTPGYLVFTCGAVGTPLVREVVTPRGQRGGMFTLRIKGDNLATVTRVRLVKSKYAGGGSTITSDNVTLVGDELHAVLDLTNAECGRYHVRAINQTCGANHTLADSFLIYAPALVNGDFEEGHLADPTTGELCENVVTNGNRPKARHWDYHWSQYASNVAITRDSNVWHICTNGVPVGRTNQHYGSITGDYDANLEWVGMTQTIAAPDTVNFVSVKAYDIYADCMVASFLPENTYGEIRLLDGDEKQHILIDTVTIQNTLSRPNPDGLIRDPAFHVRVPAGYGYTSDPPVLTIEFRLVAVAGDVCPPAACGGTTAAKAFHVDAVRNNAIPVNCNVPFADADDDGDVDQVDFGVWQECFSGTITTIPASPLYCVCFDRNDDNVISHTDLTLFTACVSGPSIPADANCENGS